jgi:hypothetical protein
MNTLVGSRAHCLPARVESSQIKWLGGGRRPQAATVLHDILTDGPEGHTMAAR